MKPGWIFAIVVFLGLQYANAQTSAPAPDPAAAEPAPMTAESGASTPTPGVTVGLEDLRKDIATIVVTTAKIAQTQEEEGSLLLKVRDGFLTNLLWELFGFKNTGKTVAGYAISLLGILGLVLKAVWFISKKGQPEPAWARGLTYAYLAVVVAVFSLLAFSGGVASELPASHSAAKPLLEASSRMEANAERLLRSIDDRLAKLPASQPQPLSPTGQEGAAAKALAGIATELKSLSAAAGVAAAMSTTAATESTNAANLSTGWGWHLLIVLLLLGVLVVQGVTYAQLNDK